MPLRSIEDAVTFASIVEKETGKATERERVAAVFHNRLKKGMRLQSDPTIIYGISGGAGTLGRGITKTDIDTKTPYNTYQINGLPPGPISNPGRAALEAALNPAKAADLYFVADGTGGHVFSETLKDHNSAVQKWREVEKQTRAKPDSKVDGAKADSAKAAEPDPDVAPIPEANTDLTAPEPASAGKAGVSLGNAAGAAGTVVVAPASAAALPLPQRKPKKIAQ